MPGFFYGDAQAIIKKLIEDSSEKNLFFNYMVMGQKSVTNKVYNYNSKVNRNVFNVEILSNYIKF